MREQGTNDTIMEQTQKRLARKAYRKQNLQVILRRSEITKSAVNFKTEDSPLREMKLTVGSKIYGV